ncbi:MAG: transglutaminase family protein [Burkholderiaceae bacterium]
MVRLECLIQLQYDALSPSTFILNVEPAASPQQRIVAEDLQLDGDVGPVERHVTAEGTRLLRFAATGPVVIRSRFTVDIRHHRQPAHDLHEVPPQELPLEVLPYLLPSRYAESDKLMDDAKRLFGVMAPGYGRIRAIAEWVRETVAFRVGTTRWDTSAADILEQRQGVCRDFAHLMIAVCRSLNVPARFVTGVDYGADPALGPVDFHAYVEVFLGDRWYLFDPTGISPTTGLLRLGTGRDASDVAFATIFGNVSCWAPYLEIAAIDRPDAGIVLPERTSDPVSTADARCVRPITPAPSRGDARDPARASESVLH